MRAPVAWYVPDAALVAAAVTLFCCLFLFQGYRTLFRDSDAGWHIRNGETIVATGRLPRTDPYSFTKAGQPWFAWEWAADAAVGAVHRAGGLRGVAFFYGLAIAAGVWMWFRLHWAMGGNFLLACAMAPLLLNTCDIHWLARPHVLGWLFLLAMVWWCERSGHCLQRGDAEGAEKSRTTSFRFFSAPAPRSSRLRVELWVPALITAAWANVHGSFFLAAVVAGAYWVKQRDRRGAVRLILVLLAPLANPYGWRLYEHVYRYLTDSDLLARIGEFQSFDFHAAGAGQIIAALLVGIAGGTLALMLGRVHHFLLVMFFAVVALRSARGLPLEALVALPIANAAITQVLPWKRFVAYGHRLRTMDARFGGWVWVPVIGVAAFALLRMVPAGFSPDQFPVAAYTHLAPGGRLFAPDKFGGYLIYRSSGARRVFFDGRSDFYGAEFLKQYGRLVQVRPGWQGYWNSFHFTQALLPNDAPLGAALEQAGWKTVYRDGTATLLEPGGT